jgi:hypothetical protein
MFSETATTLMAHLLEKPKAPAGHDRGSEGFLREQLHPIPLAVSLRRGPARILDLSEVYARGAAGIKYPLERECDGVDTRAG